MPHPLQIAISKSPQFYALALVIMLYLTAFTLASILTMKNNHFGAGDKSITEAVFGDARLLIGNRLYKQADIYFHRGLDEDKAVGISGDIFSRLRKEVLPSAHVHAKGEMGIREILPWLELSMHVNPKLLESYLVAAYWLSTEMHRPDLAENVLSTAQRNIPFSYVIQLEKAKLYLHLRKYDEALKALNATLAFWQKTEDLQNNDALLDRAEALQYRALVLESKNLTQRAIADYQALAAIAPNRLGPKKRLHELLQGTSPQPPALDMLFGMKKYVE